MLAPRSRNFSRSERKIISRKGAKKKKLPLPSLRLCVNKNYCSQVESFRKKGIPVKFLIIGVFVALLLGILLRSMRPQR